MHIDATRYQLNGIELMVGNEAHDVFPKFEASLLGAGAIKAQASSSQADLLLSWQPAKGLSLQWFKAGEKKPLNFYLDYSATVAGLISFPAPKQGAFNQALGKKTQTVLDATGGWGGDAMLMAMQGYKVHLIERDPLMALLLQDAFLRLATIVAETELALKVPDVYHANSIAALSEMTLEVDCAYLDPMFPPKRKKSAATNKQMQLLQWMVGADLDAADLLGAALDSGIKRAAVKRPGYAEPLLMKPSQQFSSKLVHYDVYLR